MEYAAFGFATLTWWTYLILLVVVFTAVYGVWTLVSWQERREERASGPRPCLEHMGTDMSGETDHWCWLIDGHEGQHINQWGVPQEDFNDTDEEIRYCFESAVGDGQVLGCTLVYGHVGPHRSHQAPVTEDEEGHYCFDFGGPDTWGCTLVYGHDGDHNSYRAPVTEPDPASCEWLPGSSSPACDWSRDCPVHGTVEVSMNVSPVDPTKRFCTYGEGGNGNPNACWKPSGHTGPHMVLENTTSADD